MSDHFSDRPFPRGALIGAAALIGFALTAAAVGRAAGVGTTSLPDAPEQSARDLRFADRDDGAVAVYEATSGSLVAVIEPGTNGFARGVLRGLARERKRQDIEAAPPFRLTRWADGRLSIEDPQTGRRIDLGAFGPTNIETFARLMAAEARTP
ncbi:MAG: hypothetical protein JNK11_15295 [Alphaproteobacteria bacterium]|nr:hypothetical protein [Alphaproteobacteria bacterium]